MINQTILEQLWESLETKILREQTGGCINEIRSYVREVENNVWLHRSAAGFELLSDLPPSRNGFSWVEL